MHLLFYNTTYNKNSYIDFQINNLHLLHLKIKINCLTSISV
ncbi:hypothetical protein CRENPOLYSF1_150082 [Crenothrix polyspora]|uniref:Uncharacterized protein n=1 Tax=Crenothrix polyspora TaxID=360316 RepID=A0A1R4H348_9GAMM|nr:hypothetical protein CRENPOLYSF1_150082 [Crenothrix polyspora]